MGQFAAPIGQSRQGGAFAALTLLLCAAAATAVAQPNDGDSLRRAERSVVRVVTISLDPQGQPVALDTGSGFVAAPGKVVTNRHVVQGLATADKVDIFVIPDLGAGGASQPAAVKQTWADADLALLSAPALASPTLPIALQAPGKDAIVHALGYPGATDEVRNLPLAQVLRPAEPYVTPGSIALFSAIAPGGRPIATIFHTAPINPGNSGGPLIDDCGRVIGVNTWGAYGQPSEGADAAAMQGEFIATSASVLLKFLHDAGVASTAVAGPCVPSAVQSLRDRLTADETAIANQRGRLASLEASSRQALDEAQQLQNRLAITWAVLAAFVLVIGGGALALRFFRRRT